MEPKNFLKTISPNFILMLWHLSDVLQYFYRKRFITQLKAVHRITEFTSAMDRLKWFIDVSFVKDKSNKAHFKLFMSKIEVKERKHHYEGIKLSKYC